jgi:hypothetical protein
MIGHADVIAGDRTCNRHRALLRTSCSRVGADACEIVLNCIDQRRELVTSEHLFVVDLIAFEHRKAGVRTADVGDQLRS